MGYSACFASTDNGASRYWLPAHHYLPDARIMALVSSLLFAGRSNRLSLIDMGAGVGQTCHELLSRDPKLNCSSYDGAGNVHEATEGFVQWIDLTRPFHAPPADWVMSLEVGEHVPNAKEAMLIRNLHAANRCGIILSWGRYTPGKRGHGDANYHSKAYMVELFQTLGYRHRPDFNTKYLGLPLKPAHFWFNNNFIGVFERITPLNDSSCLYR